MCALAPSGSSRSLQVHLSIKYACLFKFMILGDTYVDKAFLLLQFTDNRFQLVHDLNMGIESCAQMVTTDGKQTNKQNHKYSRARVLSFHHKVVSRTCSRGFTSVCYKERYMQPLENLARRCPPAFHSNMVIMLIRNKSDLESRSKKRR